MASVRASEDISATPPPTRPRAPSSAAISDSVLRNAMRYTISAREYAALHKYVLSRSRTLQRATPSLARVERALQQPLSVGSSKDKDKDVAGRAGAGNADFNAKAVRHALRVFMVTFVGMKSWDALAKKMGKTEPTAAGAPKQPFHKSPALRLSLSLSTILFLYRMLFRFLARLRAHLLTSQVEPFRRRNPRTAAALTSPCAPAVGASLAGLALGVYPSQQARVAMAIYAAVRACEFGWNVCEMEGLVWGINKDGKKRERPWWFGSWMLQPFVFGQLMHAAVFDKDCFTESYGDTVFRNSPAYLHERPSNLPATVKWPGPYQTVDSLGEVARLQWPPYISPTLFPNKDDVLPPTLTAVAPLTSQAHPLITSLSCATLHPTDPSCLRTYLTFWLRCFPPMTRFFLILNAALTLPHFKSIYHAPVATTQRILSSALRTSTFVTGAISTVWASMCFFQTYLPRHVLPTQRLFLGGFLAGFWAWVQRRDGRDLFLYSARVSVDSLWKVGVKRRWWRGVRGGDVWVFVLAMMVTGVVFERDANAIREGEWRKSVSWLRGEGFRDWGFEEEEVEGPIKEE